MQQFFDRFIIFCAIALIGVVILGMFYPHSDQAEAQPAPAQKIQKTVQSLVEAGLRVESQPQLTPDFINQILESYRSPSAGKGQTLYDLGRTYGLNSDLALAFFGHESGFGTQGMARITRSLGNLRCVPDAGCVNTAGGICQKGQSCYASYSTWEQGFEGWYRLIKNLYVKEWGLLTAHEIIPRYAPAADGNNEAGYVRELETFLLAWYQGKVRPS